MEQKKSTLVILPGWGGSHETWQDFIALANNYFSVVCIDLPCFGSEPCPSDVWGVERYAEFVKNKLDNLVDHKVILLGHSFGGQVATYFTTVYPDYVEKLILSGAAVVRPKKMFSRLILAFVAKTGNILFSLPILNKFEMQAKKFLYRSINSPDYSKTNGVKRDIYKKIIRQDFTNVLPKIKQRTLITWGREDKMTPLKYGKKIANLIPNSELKIFNQARHGLHHDVPILFLETIVEFTKP